VKIFRDAAPGLAPQPYPTPTQAPARRAQRVDSWPAQRCASQAPLWLTERALSGHSQHPRGGAFGRASHPGIMRSIQNGA
jgi:hypothetical protein